jgi:hypothetical protein
MCSLKLMMGKVTVLVKMRAELEKMIGWMRLLLLWIR